MALQTDDGAGAGGGGEARASLTLRTYDPVSGSCLKYGTDKVTELGRIVAGLGKLAGYMAALPVAAKATTDEGMCALPLLADVVTRLTEHQGQRG